MKLSAIINKQKEQKIANRKFYAPRFPMTLEERRKRNGDHRTPEGYSSSGVLLPTREDVMMVHKDKMDRAKRYQEAHKDDDKKPRGKFFITQNNFSAK